MVVTLETSKKTFIIYMAYLSLKILIHPAYEAQITLLVAKKVTILTKYLDYSNIFSKKSTAKLLEHFDINKHLMDLKPSKQPPYSFIYCLEAVELNIFKIILRPT